jgi:hypothetical protein
MLGRRLLQLQGLNNNLMLQQQQLYQLIRKHPQLQQVQGRIGWMYLASSNSSTW